MHVVAGAAACADEVPLGSVAMSFEQTMENIALGLEVLVAADIIKTITVDPSS